MIQNEEELDEVWHQFLSSEFSVTELEQTRSEYEEIGVNNDRDANGLTPQEFVTVVDHMKSCKSPEPDNIPSEVWKQ